MEKSASVDQKRADVRRLLAEKAQTLRRYGSVQHAWRRYRGRRLGPYYRLAYREGGKQCSVYLGRDADVAEEVRQVLRRLQEPVRQARALEHQLQLLKALQAEQKRALAERLREAGLHLKGNEVRGWRHLRPRLRRR